MPSVDIKVMAIYDNLLEWCNESGIDFNKLINGSIYKTVCACGIHIIKDTSYKREIKS